MIKVFHIITHFDLGGAERVAINIAVSKNCNFEYHIFEVVRGKSDFSSKIIGELKEKQINYHRSIISNKKIGLLLFPFFLLCYCVIKRPNIIHSHTEIPDLSVFIFNKLSKIFGFKNHYIRTIHNTQLWNEWKNIGKQVEPFFQKQNANIAISISTKNEYVKEFNSSDIPIIYNGVNSFVQNYFKDIRTECINILFAGRLECQKGIDELIAIIKALKDDDRYMFYVVGEGSKRSTLINELNAFENVNIYDKIYNLSQYLSAFDFIFMPSNFEGLGLVSVEASFQKVPVIINNCPGLNETLPLDWPLKVENNSVDGYLNIFNNIIPNLDKTELGKVAYNFVKDRFSIKTMQNKYEKIYENITIQN